MTIADKLSLLANTKEQIRQTLNLPTSMPFSEYYKYAQPYDPVIPPDPSVYNPVTLFAAGQQGVIYDPSDLNALYQDSSSTVPVVASGDPIGHLKDRSGNNNHALQELSTARPLAIRNTINAIRTDGVDDRLATTNTVNWLTGASANVFFAIAFKANTASVGYVVHCDNSQALPTSQSFSLMSQSVGQNILNIGGYESTKKASDNSKPTIVYVQFNKTLGTGVVSWDGAEETAIIIGNVGNTNGVLRIGARAGGAYFAGDIYGVVAVDGGVDYDSRRKVMQYPAAKAGVTL